MSAQAPPPVPAAVEEIGRRIRWPLLPALVFLGIMAALAVVAAIAIRSDPPIHSGLPEDPDVAAAAALVRGDPGSWGGLRFHSSLLDRSSIGTTAGDAERRRSADPEPGSRARADGLLARAQARHRGDPRIAAARASLALLAGDLGAAERGYRSIVDGKPGYGEARLGLGMTLALRAARETDELEARRLDLQAIGQFAAVRRQDPAFAAARHNRVVLLRKVGREVGA
jgi:hypothetical protein